MRAPIVALVALLASLALLGGCGGGDENGGGGDTPRVERPPAPAALEAAGFPRPSNRSLRALLQNLRQGPDLAQAVRVLEPGANRFAFGLFDRGNRQIADLEVGLYWARGLDETVHGPFGVSFQRIGTDARYRSRQTVEDEDAARAIYVSDLRFPDPGGYLVTAVAKLGKQLVATSPSQVTVSGDRDLPGPGDKAIRVHTPTRDSVGGDIERIETRIPPDTMHEVDLADALDEGRPVLLLFATPALCESRVCAPVTDVAEQVKAEYGDNVDFIHMEIYRDNDLKKGTTPQVRAWHLPGEPFAFAIDSKGTVVERLDGAFSPAELTEAVRKALR